MSLQVFVAHTGAQLDAEPTSFESLDALQQWIANATDIPVGDQILLTEKGRHVRLPTLLIEVLYSQPSTPTWTLALTWLSEGNLSLRQSPLRRK
jgi:hypothetical protein